MGKQKNIQVVASLKEKVNPQTTIVLSSYSGITHQDLENLRRAMKKSGADFHIVKNSLIKLALKETFNIPSDVLDKLTGPTAMLITNAGDFSSLKTFYEKGRDFEGMDIKWGVWEGKTIAKEEVERLATLPTREELIARLLGRLKGVQSGFVFVLNGNLQKLVLAINAIRESKS